MFDGTDLSSAYGSSLLEPPSFPAPPALQMSADPVVPLPPSQAPSMPPAQQPTVGSVAPGAASHAMPPSVSYNPPATMYMTEPDVKSSRFQESFWDKLANKKWDVVKLVILSLVVLLAMSVDRVGNFYLLKYIETSLLSSTQEFLVRISYPVIVLLMLWITKASS
jgi:hypothetical protein